MHDDKPDQKNQVIADAEPSEELPSPQKEMQAPEREEKLSRLASFKNWYLANKKKSIPLSVTLLLVLIFVVPPSRYKVAALVLKKDFNVQVMDATSSTPVSGATVAYSGLTTQTDGSGKARLHLAVGPHNFKISKKYYQDAQTNLTVPILAQKNIPAVSFTATGRQVKVIVSNTISQQKVGDIKIKVLDIDAKTDKDGSATIVLPVGIASTKATLSSDGFNDSDVVIEISDKIIKENKYNLTPAGKVYFLSKKSGQIDVVKANLDGSDRKTVLAGTGKEDDIATVMLASRDWKYLALLSRRDSDQAKLYIIDTTGDQATAVDEGNANFGLIGWSDDNFIYRVDRNNITNWQPKAQALKSYNAAAKQIVLLDQTRGEGTNDYDFAHEFYDTPYLIGKNVIYEKHWVNYYSNPGALNNRQAGIYSIESNGSAAQTLKTFTYQVPDKTYIYFNSFSNEAREIYYQVNEGPTASFYSYSDGKLDSKNTLADEFDKYSKASPATFLQSPKGSETIWTESRDGKNVLLLGDQDGKNGKILIGLSDEFKVYGWYSDNYLLISKKSSELYALPRSGVKDESALIKVSDYHKPVQNFYGYGGGYGGI